MQKFKTGVRGLDQVLQGGLPAERPILLCGGAGSGKSLFALSIACYQAASGRPALFVSFEEKSADVLDHGEAIGLDPRRLVDAGCLLLDHVEPANTALAETGDYTLDGLRIRLQVSMQKIDAKLVVLDTLESLFNHFNNTTRIRSELARLFHWFRAQKISLIITGEQGDGSLTRHGLEEYVSDCVLYLDNRTVNELTTRRIRVVKYRGTKHVTNEVPFLIGDNGIVVLPLSHTEPNHPALGAPVSTGFDVLDEFLGGQGLRRNSLLLLSGLPGAGKTNVAASLANVFCARNETVLYLSFEESPAELSDLVSTIGLDFKSHQERGTLHLRSRRAASSGLEQHLVTIFRLLDELKPKLVVIDPISSLNSMFETSDVYRSLVRLTDLLKRAEVTTCMTLLRGNEHTGLSMDIASFADIWCHLTPNYGETGSAKSLQVRKARGLKHKTGSIDFDFGPQGLEFQPRQEENRS